MIYFRKIWEIPLGVLLVMFFSIKGLLKLISKINAILPNHYLLLRQWQLSVSFALILIQGILVTLLVSLITFLLVDIFSGQLVRDVKSWKVATFLTREVCPDSLTLNSIEEEIANRWLKRSRFIIWERKIVLIIPCVGKTSVLKIVQDRCNQYLKRWLADNFPDSKWLPMEVKTGGVFTCLVVQEKK